MRNYSKEDSLAILKREAFFSPEEGVRLVTVGCVRCQRLYNETLEEAEAKIACDSQLLCIDCDKEASKPAAYGVRLTVWFTW